MSIEIKFSEPKMEFKRYLIGSNMLSLPINAQILCVLDNEFLVLEPVCEPAEEVQMDNYVIILIPLKAGYFLTEARHSGIIYIGNKTNSNGTLGIFLKKIPQTKE